MVASETGLVFVVRLTILAAATSVCLPLSTIASASSAIGILPLNPAAVYLYKTQQEKWDLFGHNVKGGGGGAI